MWQARKTTILCTGASHSLHFHPTREWRLSKTVVLHHLSAGDHNIYILASQELKKNCCIFIHWVKKCIRSTRTYLYVRSTGVYAEYGNVHKVRDCISLYAEYTVQSFYVLWHGVTSTRWWYAWHLVTSTIPIYMQSGFHLYSFCRTNNLGRVGKLALNNTPHQPWSPLNKVITNTEVVTVS